MAKRRTSVFVVDEKWFRQEALRIEKEIQRIFGKKPTQSFISYIMARKSSTTRVSNKQELNQLMIEFEGMKWK